MSTKTVKIDYIKAPDFKTSLITGVYGGITSNRLINFNLFAERRPIPEREELPVDEATGRVLGTGVQFKNADIVREVFDGYLVDINTARLIVGWLNTRIEEVEKTIAKTSSHE